MELFEGAAGLWAAVLLGILADLRQPVGSSERQEAALIIKKPETGPLPLIAEAFRLTTEELQRKIQRFNEKNLAGK